MANENEINIRFKVNDDGSITLEKIGQKISEVGTRAEGMNRSLGIIKWDSIVNLGERAYHAGQQILDFAKQQAQATNEILRGAQIAGLSTDAYQKLSYAAKMTDVDMESLGKGMKILAGHMDDVRKGNQEATALFSSLGISTVDAAGKTKSFDAILGDIADRFKAMPDGVSKVALAVDLFGRTGQQLIPTLNQGSAGLREFYKEAERLGIVLDESLLKKGAELDEHFKKSAVWWTALSKQVVIASYVAIQAIQKFQEASMQEGGLGTKYLGLPTGKQVRQAVGIEKTPPKNLMGLSSEEMVQAHEAENMQAKNVTYIRQSEEAIKAVAKALEEAAKKEVGLNALFASDVDLLKQADREIERRNKQYDLLEKLGIKTTGGAKKEIEAAMEDYKLLMSMGLKPEQMDQVKAKFTETLNAIKAKYSTTVEEMKASGHFEEIMVPTGEKEISGINVKTTYEAQMRWIEDIGVQSNKAKDEVTRNVEEMVKNATVELDRMQMQIEKVTRQPQKIYIDTSMFDSANQALGQLKANLLTLEEGVTIPVTVSIIGGGKELGQGDIQRIEDGLVSNFLNKRSRFSTIIQRQIEGGGVEYSNQ